MAIAKSRRAIDHDGVVVQHIPPFGTTPLGLIMTEHPEQRVLSQGYVLRPGSHPQRKTAGDLRFTVNGVIWENSQGEAAVIFANLRTALKGSAKGIFRFYKNSLQYYDRCYLPLGGDILGDTTYEFRGIIPFNFDFIAGDQTLYTNTSHIPAGPWEEYVVNGNVAVTPLIVTQKTGYGISFPGEIGVTPNGFDLIVIPRGETAQVLTLRAVEATCNQVSGAFSSGNTKIRVSTIAKGGATTSSILITIPYNSFNARTVGSIGFNSGDTIYVFVEEAAGHMDINLNIVIEG